MSTKNQGIADVALHSAIRSDDIVSVRESLAKGASPDSVIEGWPALILAARSAAPCVVEALLEAGADPNLVVSPKVVKDGEPCSALATACAWGNIQSANLLLDYGADPNLSAQNARYCPAQFLIKCDRFRKPDEDWFAGEETIDAAARLIARMIDNGLAFEGRYKSLLFDAMVYRAPPMIVRLLLDRGADPHHVYHSTGTTPFSFACSFGRVAQFKTLLEFGVDVNVPLFSDDYRYPLHYCGNLEIFQWLLQAGANVEHKNRWGKTPLAAILEDYPSKEMSAEKISMLLRAGASVNATDGNGFTVMDLIKHRKLDDVLAMVKARDARLAMAGVIASASKARANPRGTC